MTDHNLDPAAVEAAANALCIEQCGESLSTITDVITGGIGIDKVRVQLIEEATAAITAYQQAMAAQVREAVEHYENCCINYGMDGDGGDACRQYTDMDNAQRALLRLLGAAETEAER